MMGSMGAALAFGLGIAYTRPELKVVVISGDAAALMSLGTFILHKKLKVSNLIHYIIDNNCCASTGFQPTCSDSVNFEALAPNTRVIEVVKDRDVVPRIPLHPRQIRKRFENAILQQKH